MPNGRTSLFSLTKEEFRQLLGDLADAAEIGKGRNNIVTTLDVKRRLQEHKEETVTVDEQDHAWYIVIFIKPDTKLRRFFGRSERFSNAIAVGKSSPLHERLRRFHKQWIERQSPGEVVLLGGRFWQYDGKEWREERP